MRTSNARAMAGVWKTNPWRLRGGKNGASFNRTKATQMVVSGAFGSELDFLRPYGAVFMQPFVANCNINAIWGFSEFSIEIASRMWNCP